MLIFLAYSRKAIATNLLICYAFFYKFFLILVMTYLFVIQFTKHCLFNTYIIHLTFLTWYYENMVSVSTSYSVSFVWIQPIYCTFFLFLENEPICMYRSWERQFNCILHTTNKMSQHNISNTTTRSLITPCTNP